jgi:hypothetical protein
VIEDDRATCERKDGPYICETGMQQIAASSANCREREARNGSDCFALKSRESGCEYMNIGISAIISLPVRRKSLQSEQAVTFVYAR